MIDFVDKFFGALGSVKLTLTQWGVIALSMALGGLLIAFKLQGSKLHKTQVQLLQTQVNQTDDEDSKAQTSARLRYEKSLRSYKARGGK